MRVNWDDATGSNLYEHLAGVNDLRLARATCEAQSRVGRAHADGGAAALVIALLQQISRRRLAMNEKRAANTTLNAPTKLVSAGVMAQVGFSMAVCARGKRYDWPSPEKPDEPGLVVAREPLR
jgi:hypothetical protein